MALTIDELIDNALVPYSSPPEVEKFISAMGRTEDMKFSPDYQWLAITGFLKDRIYLYSTNVISRNNVKLVEIQKCIIIRSDGIREPHGVSFMGNEHLIVGNRAGAINILRIPADAGCNTEINIDPVAAIKSNYKCRVKAPGSIAVLKLDNENFRVLVCNNYIHTITSHNVNLHDKKKARNEGVLIRKGLAIPDGICISPDRKWVAVSNHCTGTALLYGLDPDLNKKTEPCGVMEGIVCPHAIRFSENGDLLFVADSASPYMHIYKTDHGNWCSTQKPYKSIRMLNEHVFSLGRTNPEEGGLKGIDINYKENLLAVTTEHLPLAFYDLEGVLGMSSLQIDDEIKEKSLLRDQAIMGL
jgi:WD40 repeat protein